MQIIKNLIGAILGYQKCPITRDTQWRNGNFFHVPVAHEKSMYLSRRALTKYSTEQLASKINERFHSDNPTDRRGYPYYMIVDEITKRKKLEGIQE
ncbi:MAG: hypothetical protein Q7S06_00775 [Nanoarchaeota archaeon]|nr:hypothetical protein [Nanoarchaeota archaeon]